MKCESIIFFNSQH